MTLRSQLMGSAAMLFAPEGTGTGTGEGQQQQQQVNPETHNPDGTPKGSGQQQGDVTDPFKDLPLEAETREWVTARKPKDVADVVKIAHEQSKLLGNAIRVPGENATDEERSEFLDKLGRPKEATGYEFTPPKELPPELPYDAERATSFKGLAHNIGLTKTQAAAVHDWAVKNAVEDFKGVTGRSAEEQAAAAKQQVDILVKEWGPLDGRQAQAQLAFADAAMREVGGAEVLAEFKRVGLIGEDGRVIQSAPIAKMFAKMGAAFYKEDDVLHGDPTRLGNPFQQGTKDFNVTAQMKMVKDDPDRALAMIAAAGKKPEDFGLKPKA